MKQITITLDSRCSLGLFSKVSKKITFTGTANDCVSPHAVLVTVELHIKKNKNKKKESKYFLPCNPQCTETELLNCLLLWDSGA